MSAWVVEELFDATTDAVMSIGVVAAVSGDCIVGTTVNDDDSCAVAREVL